MAISSSTFGTLGGRRVDQFTLSSDSGVEVDIIGYGVAVRDWRVPVKGGRRSVVLGLDSIEDYAAHSPHLGALAGRVANRIAGARFTIEGKNYDVAANEQGNTLHGGPEGLGHIVWTGETDSASNAVRFTHFSPDGAMGFPGNVNFTATYALTRNTLRLELRATTDRKTPISLVQHQYFNLGTGADVLDHRYRIEAGAYTETGADLIPTGNILEVAKGSDRDFRTARTLRDGSGRPIDYDGNFVLDAGRNVKDPVAVVVAPEGDLTLQLRTDRPGLQFYNAVTTNVPVPGLGGRTYGHHSGFCLEDQAFPDALHHAHFPSILCSPERPYSHWCEIEIA